MAQIYTVIQSDVVKERLLKLTKGFGEIPKTGGKSIYEWTELITFEIITIAIS